MSRSALSRWRPASGTRARASTARARSGHGWSPATRFATRRTSTCGSTSTASACRPDTRAGGTTPESRGLRGLGHSALAARGAWSKLKAMNKRAEIMAGLEQSAFWMPYTANRLFKKAPRLLARAEGMYYWTPEGRKVLDGCAGLWCVNAGHCRPKIVEAVTRQVATMDFAPTFQMGHPIAFEFADRLARIAPPGLSRVFFTNSGSEAVDTALKIALAYQRARGEGQRFRLIGRERGYHGVNFGGMSVGGIPFNRKTFGPGVAGVDHIRHTHDPVRNAFSRGQPAHGAELADDLERVCQLHDPSSIAAVIVEPVAGSTGVLVAPQGYLERLREICTKHGIVLIFDEVITGCGRLGKAFAFNR